MQKSPIAVQVAVGYHVDQLNRYVVAIIVSSSRSGSIDL